MGFQCKQIPPFSITDAEGHLKAWRVRGFKFKNCANFLGIVLMAWQATLQHSARPYYFIIIFVYYNMQNSFRLLTKRPNKWHTIQPTMIVNVFYSEL